MPTKRYTGRKRATKKKTYKKKSYKKKSVAIVRNPVNYVGFPKEQRVHMRYVTNLDLNLASSGLASNIFRCNSIYDPDATGTGHQPLGHDEWSLFYNHYVVTSSKINVKFSGYDSQDKPVVIAVFISDDTVSAINPLKLAEQGRCSYKLLNGFSNISTPQLNQVYSARKFFNIKDVKDNFTRLGAPFTATPNEEAYYYVAATTLDGSTSAHKIGCIVTIDYYVTMSEPILSLIHISEPTRPY